MTSTNRVLAIFTLLVGFARAETPSPIYRDPITDGAADPCMVWNAGEKCWWMLYTQRRANSETAGVSYCYGNLIAIASTPDDGRTWVYRGTLALDFAPGHNTFWAPAVVRENGVYHLFVTYIEGVRTDWGGRSTVHHYTSDDLWTWKHLGEVKLPAGSPIDPTLMKIGDTWRMWFKENSHTAVAESRDLERWTPIDKSTVTDRNHEGPIAFRLGGFSWLIVDQWDGLAVYRADEKPPAAPDTWRFTNVILDRPSKRRDDTPSGAHGDVIVDEAGGRAWIFYFTHPGREKHTQDRRGPDGIIPFALRRSSICVAELRIENGKLVERRDGLDVKLPRREE